MQPSQSSVRRTNTSHATLSGGAPTVHPEKESDDTRLALVEKAVQANSETIKVVGESLRDGLQAQAKNLDRTVDALERFRDRMEQSFDSMSKSMADLNSTMYKQGFQMIHYFRWYTIMGIITVIAVCILAGSNFYFKWKEVELRSGSAASEMYMPQRQPAPQVDPASIAP